MRRSTKYQPWRRVWVRPQRRRLEFAEVVRKLAEEAYPEAERIRIVYDQLNAHTSAAFYQRCAPEEAQRLAERIEFVYTPVHGSWLWRKWRRNRARWSGNAWGIAGSD